MTLSLERHLQTLRSLSIVSIYLTVWMKCHLLDYTNLFITYLVL
jgi:hypothetical protein